MASGQAITSAITDQVEDALRLKERGQAARAQSMLEALLAGLPAPTAAKGAILNALSQAAAAQGAYDKAIAYAEKAKAVCHHINDTVGEGKALNNAGVAELFSGNYPAAERDFGAAILMSRGAGDREGEIKASNNLGSVYLYQSRYQDALEAYQAAEITLARSMFEKWHGYWSNITLFNLATLYQKLGNYQRALDTYKEIEKSPQGLSAGDRAHLYSNLGTIDRRLGDPQKAIITYRRATALYAQERDSDGELGVLTNIGIVQALELKQLREALQTFTRALAIAEKAGNKHEVVQAHLYRGETLLRMSRMPEARDEFEAALAGSGASDDSEEGWKATYGLGRIDEQSGDRAAAENRYRETIARIEAMRFKIELISLRTGFLADKRDVYDALIRLAIERDDVEAAFTEIERSRSRVFLERLKLAGGKPISAVSLHDVQKHLDPATVLLDYWLSPDELGVLWITKDGTGIIRRALIGNEINELDSVVRALPDNASDPQARSVLDRIFPAELRAPTFGPIRHVIVIPDGVISLIPFDILSGNGQQRLIESADITYLPTALLLSDNRTSRTILPPWSLQLIAFGDPILPHEPIDSIKILTSGTSLPYSAKEVQNIAKLCTGKAKQYLGDEDRKSNFQTSLKAGAPLVHISSHAIADYERPELSRVLFSPAQDQSGSDYLLLKELYATDLHGVEMMVLSACETERATIIRGEGMQGFSRAILAAGSRSAVTSLWRVEDEATAEFMKQFYYFALQKHLPRAEALRMAKLKLLHSNSRLSHPRYWAAFVLSGDGSRLTRRYIPWSLLVVVSLVLLLAVVLAIPWIARLRRRALLLQADRHRSDHTRTGVR
jgi:CHAT domain-containing protein/tetratricopeptide (TPR) repeat protein